MKITFPHMGNSWIAFKTLVEGIGHQAVLPPPPTKRTLDLGVKYAPEFACFPFKVLLGTYLEALELGADTIISSGGVGPCRAGYYTQLQARILREQLGYDVRVITFEPPRGHLLQTYRILRELVKVSFPQFAAAAWLAWQKLLALDALERESHRVRPLELDKGTTSRVLSEGIKAIDKAESVREVKQVTADFLERFRQIPKDSGYQPLKVGVIGEIYVVLEPFVNFDVVETLGHMGVYVDRSIFLTNWVTENAFFDALRLQAERSAKKAARPYLPELVGGHGQTSVGETVLYAKRGFDGVVQLAPFTCIPEIVAKSILPRVSKDLDIPVLSLTLDEQTGKAGVTTRLEAFVDLLRMRRNRLALTRGETA
ncbi:MAG TPA: CoA protein activase [Firmicutes bacterium]|nr:CoA protein activase [Bacillota bacterium]